MTTTKCPHCAEEIQAEAKKCKHCGEWLTENDSVKAASEKVASTETSAAKADGTKQAGGGCLRTFGKTVGGFLALVLVIVLVTAIFGGSDKGEDQQVASSTTSATTDTASNPASATSGTSSSSDTSQEASVSESYPLSIAVSPGHARVEVEEAGLFSGTAYEGQGPTASFDLAPGTYNYTVSAPLYENYSGEFTIPDNKNLSVALEPTFVEAGNGIDIAEWIMQGGWEGQGVVLQDVVGGSFMNETADPGYTFALVPMAIANNSKSTQSLSFATWTLRDGQGYEYSTQTMADFLLNESDRLDVVNVPPGSTRSGFLVFQVRESVQDLYLSFEGFNEGTWHFNVN